MCHAARAKLTPEERATARRLTGLMLPVYAVAVLAIIALTAITGGPGSGERVASASVPATSLK
jgi:hypothetical protein